MPSAYHKLHDQAGRTSGRHIMNRCVFHCCIVTHTVIISSNSLHPSPIFVGYSFFSAPSSLAPSIMARTNSFISCASQISGTG